MKSHQILLRSGAIYHQEECSEITIWLFLEKEVDLSSLPYINLTAAAIHRGNLHRQLFTFCYVNRWLELEGKHTLSPEHKVTKRRRE